MTTIKDSEKPALVKGAKVAAAGTNDAFWHRVEQELAKMSKVEAKHIKPRK